MRTTPTLGELPLPPSGRTGWPWTEGVPALALDERRRATAPKITVVTPSFNQANYLEATIRSVLLQGYPNLEYFVMDGASRDGSVEIIKKYEPWITAWVSEPDGGQSAAINRGLGQGSGLFSTWINSDDMLAPNALVNLAARGELRSDTVYIGDCLYMDEHARSLHMHRGRVHSLEDLVRLRTVWRAKEGRGHIVQPEVLFPRHLALQVGGLDVQNHRTMDYELWGKFLLSGARIEYTHIYFGMFRLHHDQKTGHGWATTRSLVENALRLTAKADHLSPEVRQQISDDLRAYEREYWLETGVLARLGLPEGMVLPLRDLNASLRRRAAGFLRRAS